MYSVNHRLFVRSKPLHLIPLLVASVSVLGIGLTGCSQPSSRIRQAADQPSSPYALPYSSPNSSPNSSPTASPQTGHSAITDAEALVAMGPRVAGTPAAEQASHYLEAAFQQAGYVTQLQPFTYSKFIDRGSTLTVNGSVLSGRALNGSAAGNLTAPLAIVPNVGRRQDFAQVDVEGKIAIVQRGEIRFLEKARNAAAAGAVGLVIVNQQDENFSGTLGDQVAIPVLSLGRAEGRLLLASTSVPVTLNLNAARETVTGRNVIAHLPDVTQPKVLLGAHYDSVTNSPGANDNASGTAVLLDLARQLSGTTISRQVWFVAFDGEEDGLRGSRAFVDEAEPQFLNQLRAMLNFDMVGVNADLQVSGAAILTNLAKTVDTSITAIGETDNSDHAAFAAKDVPVLFFTRGMDPNYHSPRDQQVKAQLLDQTTQISLVFLERLLTSNLTQ